jgi:hypothetical protein
VSFTFGDDPFANDSAEGADRVQQTSGPTMLSEPAPVTSIAGPTGPPVPLLGGALAATVVALAMVSWGPAPAVPLVAWALAGPVAILVLGAFFSVDLRRRATALYQSPTWVPWVIRVTVVLIAVGVVFASVRLGDWVARR